MSYISLVSSPVALRRATLDDAPALARLLCPEIAGWLAEWPEEMDETVARECIARELAAAKDGSSLPCVVELVDPGQDPVVAGWFRLRLAAHDRDLAIMTCWLGKEFQGRGAAKGAVMEALRLAMPELGASRVGALAMANNKKSIRVLEECGLEYVGEKTVTMPARNRIVVALCYERLAHVGMPPLRVDSLPVPVAA